MRSSEHNVLQVSVLIRVPGTISNLKYVLKTICFIIVYCEITVDCVINTPRFIKFKFSPVIRNRNNTVRYNLIYKKNTSRINFDKNLTKLIFYTANDEML